jgi:hypothetical protein
VHLTWTGDGPVFRDSFRQHIHIGGATCIFSERFTGRNATVSGSITGLPEQDLGAFEFGELFSDSLSIIEHGASCFF